MWNSWCEQLAQRMNAETDRELSDEVTTTTTSMMIPVMMTMILHYDGGCDVVIHFCYDSEKHIW